MMIRGCRRALPFIAAVFLALGACALTPGQGGSEKHVADAAITASVKGALAANPRIRAASLIEVNTSNGVVRLSGFADSRQEADQAVSIAHDVAGVKRVQDDIVVRVSRDRRP